MYGYMYGNGTLRWILANQRLHLWEITSL